MLISGMQYNAVSELIFSFVSSIEECQTDMKWFAHLSIHYVASFYGKSYDILIKVFQTTACNRVRQLYYIVHL